MGTTVFARGAVPVITGIICLFTSAPARAEAQRLALPQAVEYALQHNADLKSFREEKGVRDAARSRAGVLPNPDIELEAVTGALTGSSAESNLSVGVSQEFPLAGKRGKRLTVAEREMEMYRWQLADRERVLRENVKGAFYDVILARQRVALADRSIALSRQLLTVAEDRLAAGDIPELERNLVKVELARSEGAKIALERNLNRHEAALYTLMALSGEPPDVVGDLEPRSGLTESVADLKRLARERRPDLKALEAERNRGDSDAALAEAEAVPDITAGLSVTREATAIEVGGVENKDTDYLVGVKLSMPIPLFDRNRAGVQEARARRSSADTRLSAAVKGVEREVEASYAGFLNADKVADLYRSGIVPQLEENVRLTQEAYQLGEVGILAVIREQKNFFEVNDDYLAALHDREMARVKLETAVAAELDGGAQ